MQPARREVFLPVSKAYEDFPLVTHVYEALEGWLDARCDVNCTSSLCEAYHGTHGARFNRLPNRLTRSPETTHFSYTSPGLYCYANSFAMMFGTAARVYRSHRGGDRRPSLHAADQKHDAIGWDPEKSSRTHFQQSVGH